MNNEWETHWPERRDPSVNDDGRTPYERDYARVVHSASFRRLQAKTQVLGVGDSDFYRTRLTHSMEVSQIGAAITKYLYRSEPEQSEGRKALPPPMLMRTICLSHDLGHPPFGHGGEVALNRAMLGHGGFEGNGQTLRIMSRLEPYHREYGMNLTRRALLGVLKYPAPHSAVVNQTAYEEGNTGESVFRAKPFKPPKCYFDDDIDVVDWISQGLEDWQQVSSEFEPSAEGTHRKTTHKALDTSIMEIADDIAYGIHDLEDAIGLKLITRDILETAAPRDRLQPFVDWEHNWRSYDELMEALFSPETHKRKRVIGDLVGFCVRHVTLDRSNAAGFKHPLFQMKARIEPDADQVRDALQKAVMDHVVRSTNVQQLEFKGQKIITELFHAFETDPTRLLPDRTAQKYEKQPDEKGRYRVICDHIAGMTDEYATRRYQQLFAPRVGSVFDHL